MKCRNQKASIHRWGRKVFSRYAKSKTQQLKAFSPYAHSKFRRLKSRKKSFETRKVKKNTPDTQQCGAGRPKPEKFKLAVNALSVVPRYAEDRAKVLTFFEKIHSFLKDPKQKNFYGVVVLNCQKVEVIDPSGCAFLFSYIEMFQELYPRVSFQIKYPNKIKKFYGVDTIQANHVLNHLELYKQLGSPKAPICHTLPPPKLKIWETKSFANSDSSLVGQILENICHQVPKISASQIAKIYKILIEAVNNCPEHAYDQSFMKENSLSYKKTRCLFAIIDGNLVVVVADLGVGIRYTLEHGKANSSWRVFIRWMRMGGKKTFASKDSECLKGMINIKNIRNRNSRYHEFSNRGYGGVDLQNAIRELKGKLLIMSGKGSLTLDASNPDSLDLIPKDFDIGLNGTLISMSIPLTV